MQKDNLLIDKMLKAFDKAAYQSGKVLDPYAWWPINFLFYSPLFDEVSSRSFCADYLLLRKSKSLREIALAFQYPNAVWLALSRFISTVKTAKLKKRERMKIDLEFLKMMKFLMVGSVFCEDGLNIIWNKERIRKEIKKADWIDTRLNPNFAKLFARLHGDLLSLDEAVFWNAVCATRETHGPYPVKWKGSSAQLIVREYYNLREPKLLPFKTRFPYKAVTAYTIYNTKVRFDFPVLNDYTHNLSLVENTLAVFGFAHRGRNKEFLNEERLLFKVCEVIEKEALKISLWAEGLSEKEQVVESVKRVYYRMRPIYKLLGKKWQPSKSLLEKVRKGFPSFKPKRSVIKMTKERFYTMCDPRIDP
ncbi:MAG: hypothetical protein COX12_02445 [Candidatus Brennerbacteria bacterium CG23_combo_of_CG06-09_8_20_14_all_44_41]|uniref:Uncharacterized protein n=1 Tax=Candidatus Brennerbacteria bacterium CG_4_8_14_3_um_filter_43_14 TaxID=1974521 RepID=A0A2H9N7F1_9BACT|nr:MAG: hypothetical protein AUJ43_02225 [Parcubacteria group bacterium CG1_02_44_31]PIP50240.1 MAG: hypothetical protein COX12_02445 [Candidatus Brennerbacteria bacterium CG23_combo_of_CG06-09_8_20_14_all_44_41]PIX29291.1 MAG: hypothetical protein COZ64_00370 [Candidatus Brennerbacteria bacterium CG_4_8_14_3_um_filter_43_14]